MSDLRIFTLLFWLGISLLFSIKSWRLGLGNVTMPGPGFLPFYVALLVGIFACIHFGHERQKGIADEPVQPFQGKKLKNISLALIFLAAYAFCFDIFGFFLCTLLFMIGCFKIIGQKKWKGVIGGSLAVAVSAYILFEVWLDLRLPKGFWFSWL